MNTINSWIKRNPLITAIICILAVVMLTGFISLRTNSFQNPNALFERKRNEDNLLQPGEDGNYLLTEQKVSKENMTVTPKANGALVISGYNKYGEGSYLEYDVATVTLKKGTYTLSSGYKQASEFGIYLVASYDDTEIPGDVGEAKGTFTLEKETAVTVSLRVYVAEDKWDATVYPTLVAGDKAGSFWAA